MYATIFHIVFWGNYDFPLREQTYMLLDPVASITYRLFHKFGLTDINGIDPVINGATILTTTFFIVAFFISLQRIYFLWKSGKKVGIKAGVSLAFLFLMLLYIPKSLYIPGDEKNRPPKVCQCLGYTSFDGLEPRWCYGVSYSCSPIESNEDTPNLTAVGGTFSDHLRIDPKLKNNEPVIVDSIKAEKISGFYPQFTGLKNKQAQQHLNEAIRNQRQTYIVLQYEKEVLPENVDIVQANNSYVSIKYHWTGCGASCGETIVTLNYSLIEDRVLELNDIFESDFDYPVALANYSAQQNNSKLFYYEDFGRYIDGFILYPDRLLVIYMFPGFKFYDEAVVLFNKPVDLNTPTGYYIDSPGGG